uniref:Uncharacterized protein n=1 Tax=viral metagenome TaxID=1070528 RepID=A0A6C0DD81_9ZZZZ
MTYIYICLYIYLYYKKLNKNIQNIYYKKTKNVLYK